MAQTATKSGRVSAANSGNSVVQSNVQRRSNSRRPIREYGPTRMADTATSGVGLLEAEYFVITFLLILELFVSTDSYGDKMISTMKRGTLVTLLFFILAMVAGIGPNAAKVAKGLGALVLAGILLSSPGATLIASLDNFIKADWIASDSSSADTGTQSTQGTAVSTTTNAANNSSNTITEINLPGIGPVFALGTIADSLKKLFHL
jgi:hypothetical protein